MKGVVVACGGPSLSRVDIHAPGWPIAAISTAIRAVAKPDWWITVDNVNRYHGVEGEKAVLDVDLPIVMPNYKGIQRRKTIRVEYNRARKHDGDRKLFDGQLPLLRSEHYSLTFGVQWLVISGFDCLIFCGCDLQIDRKRPYAYRRHVPTGEMSHMRRMVNRCYNWLKNATPVAAARGIQFVDWSPGGKLNEIMSPYQENLHGRQDEENSHQRASDQEGEDAVPQQVNA